MIFNKKIAYISHNDMPNERGRDLSAPDLVDFASMVDNHEVNFRCFSKMIETDNIEIGHFARQEMISKMIIEAPSAKIMIDNYLPESIFKFTCDEKDLFYDLLRRYWMTLDLKLCDQKAKITSYMTLKRTKKDKK